MAAVEDSPEYAYLATRGRLSGRPHEVELWYADDGDRIWFLAGVDPPIVEGRPDWLLNIMDDPHVTVRVGERVFSGTAVIVEGDAADHARRQIAGRYMNWRPGSPLPRWQRDGIAVVVELDSPA